MIEVIVRDEFKMLLLSDVSQLPSPSCTSKTLSDLVYFLSSPNKS